MVGDALVYSGVVFMPSAALVYLSAGASSRTSLLTVKMVLAGR